MPKQFLDDTKIDPGFQEMSCVGVPQRMDMGPLADSTIAECQAKSFSKGVWEDGARGCGFCPAGWKKPGLGTMSPPKLA